MTNAKAVPKEIPFFTMLFIMLPPIQMMYLVLSFIYIFRQTEMKVLLFRDIILSYRIVRNQKVGTFPITKNVVYLAALNRSQCEGANSFQWARLSLLAMRKTKIAFDARG